MADIERLKVIRFTTERVPNPYPGGKLPWQVYHTVRNAVVLACKKHGPTGPMGEIRIDANVGDPYRWALHHPGFWQRGDRDPSYYIIDDQYNDERHLYAELFGCDPFNPAWLADVSAALGQYPGWGLGIKNVPDCYVLLFGDRLMVKGRAFDWKPSVSNVIEVVRRGLPKATDA